MITGSITLNGIGDHNLAEIIRVKIKHEDALIFNPQQMQPNMTMIPPRPGVAQQQKQDGYNNAILAWKDLKGLKAVLEILQAIDVDLKEAGQHQAAA
jgi:hypothetical protein